MVLYNHSKGENKNKKPPAEYKIYGGDQRRKELIMKRNEIFVNDGNCTLDVSKAFYKKACQFGSVEYYALRKAKEETGYEVAFKFADKKTHHGLSFKRMEAFIRTQANAEERLMEFEAVKKIAKAKGAMYPLTKEWFFKAFPSYKEDKVEDSEKNTILDALKKAKEAEAKAIAEKAMAEILEDADKPLSTMATADEPLSTAA